MLHILSKIPIIFKPENFLYLGKRICLSNDKKEILYTNGQNFILQTTN